MNTRPRRYQSLPDAQRCQMLDRTTRRCENQRHYKCTRADGSIFFACRWCAKVLRDQIEAHPLHLARVRFEALSHYEPAE